MANLFAINRGHALIICFLTFVSERGVCRQGGGCRNGKQTKKEEEEGSWVEDSEAREDVICFFARWRCQ
jgi:hypothetical protein